MRDYPPWKTYAQRVLTIGFSNFYFDDGWTGRRTGRNEKNVVLNRLNLNRDQPKTHMCQKWHQNRRMSPLSMFKSTFQFWKITKNVMNDSFGCSR